MEFLLVAAAAVVASALTMFSGFGLGTILMPVFALFFPVELAVAATAVVHCANNIFKAALLGKYADWKVVLRFGIPAVAAAVVGAALLSAFSAMPAMATYAVGRHIAVVTPLKMLMAALMIGFAVFELHPRFTTLKFDQSYLVAGGLLSGFFGGLSGHQGALRSAFLAKVDIDPKSFVGTNAVIGLAVDLARLSAYGAILFSDRLPAVLVSHAGMLVLTGIAAAFIGVLIGKFFLHKVTMKLVQTITGTLLILIAVLLGSGIIA